MTNKNTPQKGSPPKTLRRQAEEMLRTTRADIDGMSTEDVRSLVHDLQVHQMELEIQNEELRQAQTELAESRDRYSDLYELAPVGYITLRRDGTIRQANLSASAMLGVERRALVGAKFSDYISPEGQDQWHLHRQAAFGDTKQHACELPLCIAKNNDCWVWLESTACHDEHGVASECRIALIDITQRKLAEVALERLNQSLEQQVAERTTTQAMLNDVASMANQATDVDAAIEYALIRLSQHNGWSFGHAWLPSRDNPNELVSAFAWYGEASPRLRKLRDLVQNARPKRGEGIVGRAFASGKAVFTTDVAKYVSIENAKFAARMGVRSVGAFPILASGSPVGVLEFFSEERMARTDQLLSTMENVGMLLGRVAEREQAAQSLRASEERHRAVLNAAGDGIMLLDSDGIIVSVNPATERIFGYAADELIGNHGVLLMPSLDREEHQACMTRSLQGQQAPITGKGHELLAQRKDGVVFPIEVQINEIDQGNMFVAVIHDISERKALEKQVVDAAADEQRRIGQDIHDGVGQELTGLRYMAQTHAEMLAEQASPEAKTARRMTRWLETIQRQLRAIIRELIPVELDHQGLAAALQGLAERMTQAQDLVCTFECKKSIVVQDTALATHLYRIVQEAVGNAARHARASHLLIRVIEDKNNLKVQVIDDGVGIGAMAQDNAGIGLRTMAYRAGLIGGRLSVDSSKQGGTTVTCVVPRQNRIVH